MLAWYVCTYKRRPHPAMRIRYPAINDYTPLVDADGGAWSEIEVLGGYCVVKCRASEATLDAIAADPAIYRVPLGLLSAPLSTLTVAQRTAIENRLLAMGYSADELTASLGNLRTRTLGDVLRFAASRRRRERFDAVQDLFVYDGEVLACGQVDDLDERVGE